MAPQRLPFGEFLAFHPADVHAHLHPAVGHPFHRSDGPPVAFVPSTADGRFPLGSFRIPFPVKEEERNRYEKKAKKKRREEKRKK
jgi:hypothetical protein